MVDSEVDITEVKMSEMEESNLTTRCIDFYAASQAVCLSMKHLDRQIDDRVGSDSN